MNTWGRGGRRAEGIDADATRLANLFNFHFCDGNLILAKIKDLFVAILYKDFSE